MTMNTSRASTTTTRITVTTPRTVLREAASRSTLHLKVHISLLPAPMMLRAMV